MSNRCEMIKTFLGIKSTGCKHGCRHFKQETGDCFTETVYSEECLYKQCPEGILVEDGCQFFYPRATACSKFFSNNYGTLADFEFEEKVAQEKLEIFMKRFGEE